MTVLFVLSIVIMAAAVAATVALRGRGSRPLYVLVGGTFLALWALMFNNNGFESLRAQLLERGEPWQQLWVELWAAALYTLAFVLSLGVALTFLRKYSVRLRYLPGFFRGRVYVFSSRCPQAGALAASLREKHRRAMILFDPGVNLRLHSKSAQITLFALGEDEPRNVEQALRWIEKYRGRKNTTVRVFSESAQSELLLGAAMAPGREPRPAEGFHVRRVNPAQSLVYRTLHEYSIFQNAEDIGDGKRICAVVFGLGRLGGEMAKALCWCGQMNGYRLEVHAFEEDAGAAARFACDCPGLLAHSGQGGQGEDRYELTIHTQSARFEAALRELPATFVFVAAGSDGENLDLALRMRALFERQGRCPDILVVVGDPRNAERLRAVPLVNFKGQSYDLTVVGSLEQQYSRETILNCALEEGALQGHLRYGGSEEDFYRFEYNWRSSMASAVHAKWRGLHDIQGEDAKELEHRRWNAYMRGQGYVYGPVRSDRAKTHPSLVSYQALSVREQDKDGAMVQA